MLQVRDISHFFQGLHIFTLQSMIENGSMNV